MEQAQRPEGLFPGTDTLQDRLAIALNHGAEYLTDPLNVQKADSFARSAHILAEWVVKDHLAFGYDSDGQCRDDLYQRCPDLKAVRDLSNMAKHGGEPAQDRSPYFKTAKMQRGAFSRAFSRGFDISQLVLVMQDGTELVYDDVVAQAVRFWEEFFAAPPPPTEP